MYRELVDDEMQHFIKQYFPFWNIDIWKVSCIFYEDKIEYLINEHYLFVIEKGES